MLDGMIRDHPQFQKYMAFHRFKIIRPLIRYCKEEILNVGPDPWAWFRNGVDYFNTNRRDVPHQWGLPNDGCKHFGLLTLQRQARRATQHSLHSLQPKALGDEIEDYVRMRNRRDSPYGSARGEDRHA
jgi:hypothetical protein